ncbi:MAG: hypothetical protein IKR33_08650 [Bacteroidales bacterium]|nr:hypothetical protein [Bacteroidales bacterium]
MKKIILLALALMISAVTFAQQQLATLNHNGSITVFYGGTALQQAHNAAVNGDIITLSPGSFNSVNITKAVTIRGAGMFPDTAAGTDPTTLIGNFSITINEDPQYSLYMEGLYCSGTYTYKKVYNPQYVRCYFQSITHESNNSIMENASFINCVINRFYNSLYPSPAAARNAQFVNSVILYTSGFNYGSSSLINCVASLSMEYANNVSINNSIVYNSNNNGNVNAYTSFNSIGIYIGTNCYDYFKSTGLPNHYLHNYCGYASVFKNFRGSYNDGITFELLDSVAATCLGSDGTQVGIYGGIMPFDPSVRNPLIKKCNVASRSTADGKLAVDIEIVSE